MNEPFLNKVEESGLITLDLETYYPKEETIFPVFLTGSPKIKGRII